VHNGIIENYATLKKWLIKEGCTFKSQTDTEVLVNLIGYFYAHSHNRNGDAAPQNCNRFEWAVQQALNEVCGTYGLAIMCLDCPGVMIGAKKGSPLMLGIGKNEFIFASDAAAIIEHTSQAVYLSDNEMISVSQEGFTTKTITNETVQKELKEIEISLDQIELEGFNHYMQKEISEQPQALQTCLNGRVDVKTGESFSAASKISCANWHAPSASS